MSTMTVWYWKLVGIGSSPTPKYNCNLHCADIYKDTTILKKARELCDLSTAVDQLLFNLAMASYGLTQLRYKTSFSLRLMLYDKPIKGQRRTRGWAQSSLVVLPVRSLFQFRFKTFVIKTNYKFLLCILLFR